MCFSFIGFFFRFNLYLLHVQKDQNVLHFSVVLTLPMIEFGPAQISVPKIGIPISKTACINPW